MPSTLTTLHKILTPSLLLEVHSIVCPWPKASNLDWEAVTNNLMIPTRRYPLIYKLLFHSVWVPISKLPLSDLKEIDWIEEGFLPHPTAKDFPEQCLGLIYTFDQTRGILTGVDVRYTNGFFDEVAMRITRQVSDIRDKGFESPTFKEAWVSRGWTVGDWMARYTWLNAPLVHSELYMTRDRTVIKSMNHEVRTCVEQCTGTTDPFAPVEDEEDKDLFLFPHMAGEEPLSKKKLGRPVEMSDYAFWLIHIDNAHFALTDRFGRYPYRNDTIGREYTKEELKWMDEQGLFERLEKGVREQIRRDVEEGVWSPLKGNPKYEDLEGGVHLDIELKMDGEV